MTCRYIDELRGDETLMDGSASAGAMPIRASRFCKEKVNLRALATAVSRGQFLEVEGNRPDAGPSKKKAKRSTAE